MDDDLFDDPVRRRWWLLTMALDGASLDEALRLASAVEAFLGAPGSADVPSAIGGPRRAWKTATQHHVPTQVTLLASLPLLNEVRAVDPGSGDNGIGAAVPGSTGGLFDDAAEDSDPAIGQLAVLAFPDEVVRFLRLGGDVVVSDGDAYLVNGTSRETLAQLIDRANRIRAGRGLPAFQLAPTGWAPAALKGRASA